MTIKTVQLPSLNKIKKVDIFATCSIVSNPKQQQVDKTS